MVQMYQKDGNIDVKKWNIVAIASEEICANRSRFYAPMEKVKKLNLRRKCPYNRHTHTHIFKNRFRFVTVLQSELFDLNGKKKNLLSVF